MAAEAAGGRWFFGVVGARGAGVGVRAGAGVGSRAGSRAGAGAGTGSGAFGTTGSHRGAACAVAHEAIGTHEVGAVTLTASRNPDACTVGAAGGAHLWVHAVQAEVLVPRQAARHQRVAVARWGVGLALGGRGAGPGA